jgi:hypothetical protein
MYGNTTTTTPAYIRIVNKTRKACRDALLDLRFAAAAGVSVVPLVAILTSAKTGSKSKPVAATTNHCNALSHNSSPNPQTLSNKRYPLTNSGIEMLERTLFNPFQIWTALRNQTPNFLGSPPQTEKQTKNLIIRTCHSV